MSLASLPELVYQSQLWEGLPPPRSVYGTPLLRQEGIKYPARAGTETYARQVIESFDQEFILEPSLYPPIGYLLTISGFEEIRLDSLPVGWT